MTTTTNNGSSNGNGNALAKRAPADLPAAVEQMEELPPWMKALRDAMSGSITADDIKDVMKAQVEKAKQGDMRSASFVMNQAHKLMSAPAQRRPVQIIQNNYYDTPAGAGPDAPILPGDEHGTDLLKMRSRARAGKPLTGNPDDMRTRPVSDEEEKELRRRQQEQETEAAGDPLRD